MLVAVLPLANYTVLKYRKMSGEIRFYFRDDSICQLCLYIYLTFNLNKMENMITIKIGTEERRGIAIKTRWIAEQIRKRRDDGHKICVKAVINEDDVHITLTTPACVGGGGGRKPNKKERKLFELWERRGLNGDQITAGDIISFLKQYKKFL